jgi:hypothetical protein
VKKTLFAWAVLLLAVAAFPVPATTCGLFQSCVFNPRASPGAVVVNDLGCGLFDGNGGAVVSDESHSVITMNKNGNGVAVCKATVTPSSTGKTVHYNNASTGGLCETPAGFTDDWQETVSADGQATVSCHVNGS